MKTSHKPLALAALSLALLSLGACRKSKLTPDFPEPICQGLALEDISQARKFGNGRASSCTEEALRQALSQGGTIVCDCGKELHRIKLSAPLVISLNTVFDGQNKLILDGQDQSRIFIKEPGASFSLQNIRLERGKAPSIEGRFSFEECGGAILARGNNTGQAVGGNLRLVQVHFKDNSTGSLNENDVAGGALYAFNVPQTFISGCTFEHNRSSNGGAVGGLGGDIIAYNSRFIHNSALGESGYLTGHGGAINMDGVELSGIDKKLELCGCLFKDNFAQKQGGATNTVFSDGQNTLLHIDRSHFQGNKVGNAETGNGGAIFHVEDDHVGASQELNIRITNSSFSQNEAGRQGGALWFIIDGRAEIDNCSFHQNKVLLSGGSLGGAMALSSAGYGGRYTLRHLTLSQNHSAHFAGAVFVASNNQAEFINSIFSENRSDFEWEGHQLAGPGQVSGSHNLQYPEKRPNNSDDRAVPGRILTSNPLLGPLQEMSNGTWAQPLSNDSPARDAGTSTNLNQDQGSRPRQGQPDLGAYELQ